MFHSARSRLAFVVVNLVFCVTLLELLSVASSWKITRKCPYGHYYNDGCITCWCDTNTGHTNCQRSSSCNRVNVKCQKGKEYKDECGNSCKCNEETGAVFCSTSNPQCPKMKPIMNKEDIENMKSTTSKPIIPKIHVPVLTPVKNNFEVFQPLILRRSTVMKKSPPLYDMDYNNGPPPIISLYEKIKKIMSKKIKETIDDVIQDELMSKPLNNIFARPLIENKNSVMNFGSGNVRPLFTTHFPEPSKKGVSERIEEDLSRRGSSNNHEVFIKAPSGQYGVPGEGKKSPALNYKEKSDDLKESYVREPLLSSEGSESQKVLTYSHPSQTPIRPMLSNFEDRIKANLGSSFHNTSPKPFSYNTFQVNTPSLSYEESTPRAVTMNFSERTPTRTPSFTFEKSGPRFTLDERVHQSTSHPRIYDIIVSSTPRPYFYDNQSNSSKPIIHEYVQSTTPQYSNFQYSTARRTFLESIGAGSTPRPNYTLQPSIYDFESHAQKYNIYDKSYQRQNHLHQSYIHGSSTPIPTLYSFPQSTPKPLNANFNHATQKTMQHSFHQNSQKPIIRLIFQQSTSKPPSFLVRNHNGRFSTNKPGNSNYLRTTSIADPSRFIFHQMTTRKPAPLMRLHPNTPQLYKPYHNTNFNSPTPSFTNMSPVYSSPNNLNVNKGTSFVYIFHETKPRENIHITRGPPHSQSSNNFHRQPLLQNPSTVIPQYITSPSRIPNNFFRSTPRPMVMKTTPGTQHVVSNSRPNFEMTSLGNPVTASYSFEHLSPNPIAHRLEDEIPKPPNFNFEENTPKYVSFNVHYNKPTTTSITNAPTRKPVVLKYKNWVSAASTKMPTTVRPTTVATTTRRPKTKKTKVPVDFSYPPPTRANSAPVIKIHNHGTRTDNAQYDYNSHKIDSSNTPINYSNSNEGVSASSVSPLLNYDYSGVETPTKSSSPEQEEEINHEEMIPKELILDPQSGPMTVIFDHDNGQESLKFSDRKGHDPVVTFSQDNPENPIEVDVDTTTAKSTTDVDLEELLEKEPDPEYQPVFVDLEKEEKKTPIVTIKSESGNKNVQDYSEQSNLREPITYYDNQESIGKKQAEEPLDIHLAVTPSDIVTYDEEHFDAKENYENLERNDKTISDIEDKEEETAERVEPLDYDSENQQEPSTSVMQDEQPQEMFVMNEYEQEEPKEIVEEVMESNPHIQRITPSYGYNENGENEGFYDTQQEVRDRDSTAEVYVTPINFDFPNQEAETTPATNVYDDQGESSYGYAEDSIHHNSRGNQHQFMHKSGEELLSELPLVENKGEILRFKFAKDEKINKKPLLVSFKKQGRPYRASAYLKTDAVADVFSFYHKMRQESAKRAVAAAEKRRLEIPSSDSILFQDDYFSTSRTSNNKRRQSTDDQTKKVSRGTDSTDTDQKNSNKPTRIHSSGFAEALKSESTSNDRASFNERRDRHNLNKDMADKLDWKLEIEV